MATLPPLPATLRALTDEEIERVNRDHPRPEGKTIDDWCPTCWGDKSFLYYSPDDMIKPHVDRGLVTYEVRLHRPVHAVAAVPLHRPGRALRAPELG